MTELTNGRELNEQELAEMDRVEEVKTTTPEERIQQLRAVEAMLKNWKMEVRKQRTIGGKDISGMVKEYNNALNLMHNRIKTDITNIAYNEILKLLEGE